MKKKGIMTNKREVKEVLERKKERKKEILKIKMKKKGIMTNKREVKEVLERKKERKKERNIEDKNEEKRNNDK